MNIHIHFAVSHPLEMTPMETVDSVGGLCRVTGVILKHVTVAFFFKDYQKIEGRDVEQGIKNQFLIIR